MKTKVRGSLFASGILFLIFFSALFLGQLEFFNNHLIFYRSEINLKEAQTMRNMAQTHHLQDNQELKFNTGKVCFHEQRYEITLKNGNRYSFEPFK